MSAFNLMYYRGNPQTELEIHVKQTIDIMLMQRSLVLKADLSSYKPPPYLF